MTQAGKLVLVVDDNAQVRDLIATTLLQMNMVPIQAHDGVHALLEFRERGPLNFIGAIIDLMMPNLDGTHVIRELRLENPKLVSILCTGYPTMLSNANKQARLFDAVLEKPFSVERFKTVFFRAIMDA